jgi:phage shock protein C
MEVRLVKGGAMDPTRKLYRSRTNRQVAGVYGGLAQHFNVDVTLIRVLFAVLAVLGGSGLVLCGHVDHHPEGAVSSQNIEVPT